MLQIAKRLVKCSNASMKFLILFTLLSSINAHGVLVGAQRSSYYLPLIKDKRVALVVNQTSRVNGQHLIDYLLSFKIKINRLFALEHGLRGDHDAGQDVQDGVDVRTGISVTSLYGKNKRPTEESLRNVDTIIFDIQDVGVRFYTYISSLYYILEACSEYQKHCIIMDRPNPLANQVSGPVMSQKHISFLGKYPIPIVYGLTIGELTNMIVGEKWIKNVPKLTVVTASNWKRSDSYKLPIKPSPNLPTQNSVMWYPTLALFEPTVMSIGRGTTHPFEVIGFPNESFGTFKFKPISIPGMSKHPKHQEKWCFGEDLRQKKSSHFTIKYLVKYYQKYARDSFITHKNFFFKLVGNERVFEMLTKGKSYLEIEQSWQAELEVYKNLRKKYLIYR